MFLLNPGADFAFVSPGVSSPVIFIAVAILFYLQRSFLQRNWILIPELLPSVASFVSILSKKSFYSITEGDHVLRIKLI